MIPDVGVLWDGPFGDDASGNGDVVQGGRMLTGDGFISHDVQNQASGKSQRVCWQVTRTVRRFVRPRNGDAKLDAVTKSRRNVVSPESAVRRLQHYAEHDATRRSIVPCIPTLGLKAPTPSKDL